MQKDKRIIDAGDLLAMLLAIYGFFYLVTHLIF